MKVAISSIRTKNVPLNRLELIKRLQREGHEVYYIGQRTNTNVHPDYARYNVTFLSVPLKRININPLYEIYSILQTKRVIKANKIEVIMAYGIRTFPMIVISAKLASVKKIICTINGSGRLFQLAGLKGLLVKFMSYPMLWLSFRLANHVFFQNPDDMKLIERKKLLSKKNFSTINGSGVNMDVFSLKPLEKKPVFSMISRLTKSKGVREYIEAAKIVKEKFPCSQFYLIGPIDDKMIENELLEKAVKDNIIILKDKVDDVRPCIEKTRIFVLPSYYPEGVPRSILEAMAMGRPIITTDTPGCRETVINGLNGYLVKPKDIKSLSASMMHMISNSDLTDKMGLESRKICEEKFNVYKINEKILKEIN